MPAMQTAEAHDMLSMLLDSADAFVAGQHDRRRLRLGVQATPNAVDPAIWRQMAELGWLGLCLPEELGGAGLALRTGAALCEKLGRDLLPEPLIASAVIPGVMLGACPPGQLRARLAKSLVDGEGNYALAWQARAGQIDIEAPTVELIDGRLYGSAVFVPFSLPRMTVLVAAIEAGEMVVVPVAAEDTRAEIFRMGDGGCMAMLSFDGTAMLAEPLARGRMAEAAMGRALEAGTIALAASLAGLADGALSLALTHLRTREQFGQKIGAFQALQHRAVDLLLAVRLAGACWRAAAKAWDAAPGAAHSRAAISAAKACCGKAARRAGQEGVQMFGAMGFTEEAEIGLYMRSALHGASWLGGETAHRRRFHDIGREPDLRADA